MKSTVVNIKHDLYDVFIGRPSKWSNPFVIGVDGGRIKVIDAFEEYIRNNSSLLADLHELRGKRLGCYCSPKFCHGHILLKLLRERFPEDYR